MAANQKTQSLCPECRRVIDATISARGGQVFLEKECPEHGRFEDVYWSDEPSFDRAERLSYEGSGVENPRTEKKRGCPLDCGICPGHRSHTVLGIIDVTNRCNLKCPICFANAAAAGYVYEPSQEQITAMLTNLRSNRPLPAPALQFSGGEPTLREDLPELIRTAKRLGFLNVEVNTNGIRFSQSLEYCRTLKEAGLDTVYLQFDGLTPDASIFARGRDLVATKMAAIENFRRAGMRSIVLVVTLIKGINDGQLGDIVRFAADNFDVIRCVNAQPLAFAGRVPGEDLRKRRITIPDFMKAVEEQTGGRIGTADFYPVPSEVPMARAVGALRHERYPEFTAHPHCGTATYLFLEKGEIVPIGRAVDVPKFLKSVDGVFRTASRGRRLRAKLRFVASLRHVRMGMLRKYLRPLFRTGSFEALDEIHYQMILLSAMHFMDAHNFDVERVRRCLIHYAVPDGRLIPFCAYNNLGYREKIEKTFSRRPADAHP